MNFIKNLFAQKENDLKIGLSQFKNTHHSNPSEDVSIRTKNIKLSDLMRRAS